MRICVFIYGLTGGGATRRVLTLAEGLARKGHQVSFLVINPKGPLLDRFKKGPLRLVPLDFGLLSPLISRLSRRQQISLSPWALAKFLRRERPEIFLSAANHVHLAALAGRRKSGLKIPLVLRLSNHVRASLLRKKGLKGLLARRRFSQVRRYYRKADFIVAVSRGILEDLLSFLDFPEDRTAVIYNPIDVEEIQKKAREPVEHPWFKEKKQPLVLAAGRLSAQKDFATLIRAFAILRRHLPARLVILGEGKQRPKLERLIRELGLEKEVDLPGFTPNPWAYMARADLFVLSSRWEGLPGVLLEALAVGCPVVSTDCPSGPREILANGRYGPLVPVGDDKTLAKAMFSVLKSPPPKEKLIQRAREFDLEKAVDSYLEIFAKLTRKD